MGSSIKDICTEGEGCAQCEQKRTRGWVQHTADVGMTDRQIQVDPTVRSHGNLVSTIGWGYTGCPCLRHSLRYLDSDSRAEAVHPEAHWLCTSCLAGPCDCSCCRSRHDISSLVKHICQQCGLYLPSQSGRRTHSRVHHSVHSTGTAAASIHNDDDDDVDTATQRPSDAASTCHWVHASCPQPVWLAAVSVCRFWLAPQLAFAASAN